MTDETARGAAIIRHAIELMRAGQARSWSRALELARQEANKRQERKQWTSSSHFSS